MADEGLCVGGGATYYMTSLLDHPDFTPAHLATMKYAGLSGAPVPAAVTERLTAHGITVYRSYGSTEHPSVTGSHHTDPERKRLYTDGAPLTGVEVRLSEDGEILSRGPDLCLGYTDPELTACAFDDEGWYHTGDTGTLDKDGYLTITGRKSDMIIRGGENISTPFPAHLRARLHAPSSLLTRQSRRHGAPPARSAARLRRAPSTDGTGQARGGGDPRRRPLPANGQRQGAEVHAPHGHCSTPQLRIGFSYIAKEDLSMPSRELPYPLFDADNHLYETEEAFLKYLPKQYAGAIQYVQIKGRTKIAIRGQISEYIPNPTFEVVARPGAMEEYFAHGRPLTAVRRS